MHSWPHNLIYNESLLPERIYLLLAVVKEVLRSFTGGKVITPQCNNTQRPVEVLHSSVT